MSYKSELKSHQNQGSKFINPTQLAFILSLVLHLLIYKFGLPRLHLQSDSGKREVSIVQLTPEQQSRLPNLYPEPNIPETLTDDIDIPLDSDPPAPPYAFTPNMGLPNLPPLVIPPPPNFDIPPLPPPPITDIKLPPIGDLSSLPLPPPLESLDIELKPETPPKTETKPQPETKPQSTTPPQATQPETKPKPKEETEEEEKAQPQPSPQQIAAQKQQNLQRDLRSLSASLQKKETGTSNENARKNYVYWLTKVNNIEPESLIIDGTYPRDACIRRLEGQTVYGVVVDPKGQVVALDLIKGAKYPLFNEQASKDISSKTLKNDTEAAKPYRVTVNYEYDAEICPSLTLPSLRRDNQPKPEAPKPTPETPPKPEATETAPKPEATETPPKPEATETAPKPEATETAPKPEATETAPKPEATETAPKPEATETAPKPEATETAPRPTPQNQPVKPSLRERLRNVPLPDRKPSDLKDTPLPEKPRL